MFIVTPASLILRIPMNPLAIPDSVRPTGETNTFRVASGSEKGLEYLVVLGQGCDCPHFRMGQPARARRAAGGAIVFPTGCCKHYKLAAYAMGILSAEALDRLNGNKKYLGP